MHALEAARFRTVQGARSASRAIAEGGWGMTEALLTNAAVLIALVLILWLISVRIDDVSFIDAFWGAGMGVMAIASFAQTPRPGKLSWLILLMTCAWGFRLGLYLLRRWMREGEDKRYARILKADRAKENGRAS